MNLESHLLGLQLKLNELNNHLKELTALIHDLKARSIKIPDWITESETQKLLGLKETSLWAMRKRKQLTFTKVGSKTFYSLKSIEELMNRTKK